MTNFRHETVGMCKRFMFSHKSPLLVKYNCDACMNNSITCILCISLAWAGWVGWSGLCNMLAFVLAYNISATYVTASVV